MRPFSPVLASLASTFCIPLSQTIPRPAIPRISNPISSPSITSSIQPSAKRTFSATSALLKRKRGPKAERRITLIRYFLNHPKTPRPLRFSRTRYLRHWTIHRAWHRYQAQRRQAQELELQRQWQAMGAACEELRTGAGDGGKMFRIAMQKKGIFTNLFPIEYGRLQTEWPSFEGWDHEWKRPEKRDDE